MSQSAVVFISILCVASHSGNASFLTNLSENVTATRSHVTFSDCIADCESRSRCAEAQYYRRYNLCQFLKNPSNARTPGVTNYIKPLSSAPDKVHIFISIMHISSPNPMFEHLLESFHGDDSNNWSNIGLGEVITQVVLIEVHFMHLIWSSDKTLIKTPEPDRCV